MPRVAQNQQPLTFEEYLRLEEKSDVRHEFVDGFMFAMAGGSNPHSLITGNIFARLWLALENNPDCEVHVENMKLLANSKGYYPDVMVTCDLADLGQSVKKNPCLIVEVLSDSTEDIDRGEKWNNYQRLEHLKMYVLVNQHQPRVEVFTRNADGSWRYEALEGEAQVRLACANITLTMPQLYAKVRFDEPSRA